MLSMHVCRCISIMILAGHPFHQPVSIKKLAAEHGASLKEVKHRAELKQSQLQEFSKGCERISAEFEAETQTLIQQIRSTMESQVHGDNGSYSTQPSISSTFVDMTKKAIHSSIFMTLRKLCGIVHASAYLYKRTIMCICLLSVPQMIFHWNWSWSHKWQWSHSVYVIQSCNIDCLIERCSFKFEQIFS